MAVLSHDKSSTEGNEDGVGGGDLLRGLKEESKRIEDVSAQYFVLLIDPPSMSAYPPIIFGLLIIVLGRTSVDGVPPSLKRKSARHQSPWT